MKLLKVAAIAAIVFSGSALAGVVPQYGGGGNGILRSNVGVGYGNHQIANAIASGSKEGMISMDQALLELYRKGLIAKETALEYSDSPDLIRRQLN